MSPSLSWNTAGVSTPKSHSSPRRAEPPGSTKQGASTPRSPRFAQTQLSSTQSPARTSSARPCWRFPCCTTHISAHAVLLLRFPLLGVDAVVCGAPVLLAGSQAFRGRHGVILQKKKINQQARLSYEHKESGVWRAAARRAQHRAQNPAPEPKTPRNPRGKRAPGIASSPTRLLVGTRARLPQKQGEGRSCLVFRMENPARKLGRLLVN